MLYLECLDTDNLYNGLKRKPIIINKINPYDPSEIDKIKKIAITQLDGETLTSTPFCSCGEIGGSYHMLGVYHPKCKTYVSDQSGSKALPLIWLEKPEGVSKLINIGILTELRKRFKISNFDTIEYLINPKYIFQGKRQELKQVVEDLNIPRNYNYFSDNLLDIVDKLLNINKFKLPKTKKDLLPEFLEFYKDQIYTDYIPFPNKTLLIKEDTNVGVYTTNSLFSGLNSLWSCAGIDVVTPKLSSVRKQQRVGKALIQLIEFNEETIKRFLNGKPGVPRRHAIASRTPNSGRGVIISHYGKHRFDEIHLPWKASLNLFKPYIFRYMDDEGLSPDEADRMFYETSYKPNNLMIGITEKIIRDCGPEGAPFFVTRNPIQLQLSIQYVFATHIKTNVFDEAYTVSPLIQPGMGGDFDGDQENFKFLETIQMRKDALYLKTGNYAYDLHGKPGEISKNMGLPKPAVETISAFVSYNAPVDERKLKNLKTLGV